MSEATYDSLEGEAYESEAYEGEGEAYEGEAYEGEAGYEAYGEESRAQRDRRNRQRQIMLARQQQLQRQRRSATVRSAPRPAPATVTAATRPAPATLNAIRAVDLDAKVAQDSLRRQLEKARRNAQWSTYSAIATGAVSQALDTFEGNLADHPFVRAGLRLAPQALLPATSQRKGIEAVLLHPAFLATAAAGGILLAGRLANTDKTARAIDIIGPDSVDAGTSSTFLAEVTDSAGRIVTNLPLTWTSSDNSTLSFPDPGRGAFTTTTTGPSAASVIVTVTAGNVQKSKLIQVFGGTGGRADGSSPLSMPAPSSPAAPREEVRTGGGDHDGDTKQE
jgi:hypothetical protein